MWWLATGCGVATLAYLQRWPPLLCVMAIPLWPAALVLLVIMREG